MNKTIKKIVALGMGASMLAGTAAIALASDLSDYPAPFVKDGVFVGKIVIGEKAASIDTVGALDVAASLQRSAAVSVGGSGSGSSSVSADGYKFKENEQLILGSNLESVGKSTIDDSDLPDLLASGTVEADDGSTYDYDVEVRFGQSNATVAADVNSDLQDMGYEAPVVYLDLENGNNTLYQTVIDFDDLWNADDFVNSETISLFGKEYTFDPNNGINEDKLTLFGSQDVLTVGKGASEKVSYMGKDYTVEVLGGNSDDSSAIVRINGDTRTLTEGDSKTMGGLPIYVKNVFVSNIGGDDVSVQLFLGSDKIEIDQDGTVTKNEVDLDEVTASFVKTAGNWTSIDSIVLTVRPSAADDEMNYLLPGESYVDPVFGAFKVEFVGSKDLKAGKELVSFTKSGDKLNFEFTPREASQSTSISLLDHNATDADLWDKVTLNNLSKDKIFLYNDGSAEDNYATHVLQITKIKHGNDTANSDFEVDIDDLSHDKKYTVTSPSNPVSSDIGLYVIGATAIDNISFSGTSGGSNYSTVFTAYTNAGAKIKFLNSNATGSFHGGTLEGSAVVNLTVNVTEDVDADDESSSTSSFTQGFTWDSSDNEYDISNPSGAVLGSELGDNDNVNYYLTGFGTYVEKDTDESSWVKIYIPSVEVSYDAFLLPVDSSVTTSSGSSGGAVALNPIAVGLAILDSEASLGSKPYIVVGGPCANTVAAALLGNPAVCYEGFTEGKAVIKLFSDKNALLVAGYSGKDTQGASRVLANYADYAFSGSELEVVTTNLNSLSVKKLS